MLWNYKSIMSTRITHYHLVVVEREHVAAQAAAVVVPARAQQWSDGARVGARGADGRQLRWRWPASTPHTPLARTTKERERGKAGREAYDSRSARVAKERQTERGRGRLGRAGARARQRDVRLALVGELGADDDARVLEDHLARREAAARCVSVEATVGTVR